MVVTTDGVGIEVKRGWMEREMTANRSQLSGFGRKVLGSMRRGKFWELALDNTDRACYNKPVKMIRPLHPEYADEIERTPEQHEAKIQEYAKQIEDGQRLFV